MDRVARRKKLLKDELHQIDQGGQIHFSQITQMMSYIRVFLEATHTKHEYPILSLYCDWLLHDEISRNVSAWDMLDRLDNAITIKSPSNTAITAEEHIEKILSTLSLLELRAEFIRFLSKNDLQSHLVQSFSNWKEYVRVILHNLCEKPLSFPSEMIVDLESKPLPTGLPSAAKKIREKIIKKHQANGSYPNLVVNSLNIIDNMDGTHNSHPPGYLYHIMMGPQNGVQLRGSISLPEGPEAFSHP